MICIFRRKSIQDPAIARLTVVTSLALLKSDVALSMSALVITIHNNSYRPQLGINQPFTKNLYLSPLGRSSVTKAVTQDQLFPPKEINRLDLNCSDFLSPPLALGSTHLA
jgi:hypothetical protein